MARKKRKQRKLLQQEQEESEWGTEFGQDDHYAYIAGFTAGGAAFGIIRRK